MTQKEKLVQLSYEKPELRSALAAIIRQADSIFVSEIAVPYRVTVDKVSLEDSQILFEGYILGPGLAAQNFTVAFEETFSGLKLLEVQHPEDPYVQDHLKGIFRQQTDVFHAAFLNLQEIKEAV